MMSRLDKVIKDSTYYSDEKGLSLIGQRTNTCRQQLPFVHDLSPGL